MKTMLGLLLMAIISYCAQSQDKRSPPTRGEKEIQDLLKFKETDLMEELRTREATNKKQDPRLMKYDTRLILQAIVYLQTIYGNDDRQDWFQLSAVMQLETTAVAIVVPARAVFIRSGTATILTDPLGLKRNLCPSELFRFQPSVHLASGDIQCSGVLVGRRQLATAKHCINADRLQDSAFVFDFRMINGTTVASVPESSVFWGQTAQYDATSDWAVVTLDRDVQASRPLLPIRRSGKIADGTPLFIMGYPTGLPVKSAGNAKVIDNSDVSQFKADLDAFGGNSGSPVLSNAGDAAQIEGILLQGGPDYQNVGTCTVAFRCPNAGCSGETSLRSTVFASAVP